MLLLGIILRSNRVPFGVTVFFFWFGMVGGGHVNNSIWCTYEISEMAGCKTIDIQSIMYYIPTSGMKNKAFGYVYLEKQHEPKAVKLH